jgi:hypothetical protein
VKEEEEYVNKRVHDRPRVETFYDQKKVDDTRRALEGFWKARGITVEISTNLTQVPSAPRYAFLSFTVYQK